MHILVIGKTGQLARALSTVARGAAQVGFLDHQKLDLMIPGMAQRAIAAERPELVINAAAYTAVDDAETERETAERINGAAVGEIARAAAAVDAALIHISTDYVFDGGKREAYVETDPVDPANAYGASKWIGELAALEENARAVVLRTSWLYSPWGRNFVLTMLRLARKHDRLRIVDDQYGNPTSALDLAGACLAIAGEMVRTPAGRPVWGLYHYAGRGACSWADFAAGIFEAAAQRGIVRPPGIDRISTADYPTPARRPRNSALDCRKFEATFGLETISWRVALAPVLALIAKEGSA
jgi:dTDP-4-dehydrorhamnose reductase